MDTLKIKAAVAAVKYKSLSRAAEEFSYTPSAFSHMMTSFEAELGVKLFNRSFAGVELTEEGRELYPKLMAVLSAEKKLLSAAENISGGKERALRIAMYPSISRNLLSGILKSFKEEYPEIQLSVNVADSLAGWLDGDRADIIFADEAAFEGVEWTPIMEDEFLAVAPSNMLEDKTVVTREELYGYPNLYTDDIPVRKYFDTPRFKELIYFKSEDDLSVINMVKAGMGIAVLPALVLKETADGTHLLRLDPPLKRTLGFAYRKDLKGSYSLSRFIKFIGK